MFACSTPRIANRFLLPKLFPSFSKSILVFIIIYIYAHLVEWFGDGHLTTEFWMPAVGLIVHYRWQPGKDRMDRDGTCLRHVKGLAIPLVQWGRKVQARWRDMYTCSHKLSCGTFESEPCMKPEGEVLIERQSGTISGITWGSWMPVYFGLPTSQN